MNDAQYLDYLASHTTSTETLNALHACRPGHPWNKGNTHCWRNAYALVLGRTMDFLSADLRRLASRANTEAP